LNEESYSEDIETCCSQIRRTVILTLSTPKKPFTSTITGYTTECNYEGTLMLKHTDEPWVTCNQSPKCMLKKQITTGRRK
jgi:hypothetical protein